jgi:hypothetical protein
MHRKIPDKPPAALFGPHPVLHDGKHHLDHATCRNLHGRVGQIPEVSGGAGFCMAAFNQILEK